MSSSKKITKVLIEYEDGSGRFITDKDAEEWERAANAQAFLCYTHGMTFPVLNWKDFSNDK